MRRRDFVEMCSVLGLSVALPSCVRASNIRGSRFDGKVLVIGSGAAGMSAGYLLKQRGVDFSILEASDAFGGRMKQLEGFADFPVPLGAEWLHVDASVLSEIASESGSAGSTELVGYSGREAVAHFTEGRLVYASLSEAFGDEVSDKKFVGSTWHGFFAEHVAPSIEQNLVIDTEIVSIDSRGERVVATDAAGVTHEADRVILTVPLKMLQQGKIAFEPELPEDRVALIQRAPIWGGLKAFLVFSERFYPTFLTFPDSETSSGQRLYFDACHGQSTSMHLLGLFAVGEQAKRYLGVSGDEQLRLILDELDEVFGGEASRRYVKHVVQNWDAEAFVESAYLADNVSSDLPKALGSSIEGRVFFAGEAYTDGTDWGSVHAAARSARRAVDAIISRGQ